MNKVSLCALLSLNALASLHGWSSSTPEVKTEEYAPAPQSKAATMENAAPQNKKAGNGTVRDVVALSELENLLKNNTVIVKVHGTWCGPCKKMKPYFEEVAAGNNNALFVAVDIDKGKDIANKHKVQSLPTVIVFQNGKEVKRLVGGLSKDQLQQALNPYLK